MIEIHLQKRLQSANGLMQLNVDILIVEGTIVSLYGKSGAGKTSILRMLAGLMQADAGRIALGDTVWLDSQKGIDLSPQKRKVGFLFQDYALFPNMNVEENLRFALEKGQNPRIIDELVEMMELGDLRHQKTTHLSGGQQQRVALGRTLVQKPDLLLLDEPLSALDTTMRHKLQDYILDVHRKYGLTIVLVSHDKKEISKLASQVHEIEAGKITQSGTPAEVFNEQVVQLAAKVIEVDGNGLIVQIGENKIRLKQIAQFEKIAVGDTVNIEADLLLKP